MPGSEKDRWVALAGTNWLTGLIVVSPLIMVLFLTNGLNFAFLFVRSVPLPWSIVIMIGSAAAIIALCLVVLRLLYPPAGINAGSGRIRAGRRTAAYSEVTTAQLLVSASKSRRNLNLLLRSDGGLRAVILIRDVKQRTLNPDEAKLVSELIRCSNIAMPKSADDPRGTFARYNFPDNVTKEDALELVANPPSFDDPLPIPPRV